MSQLKVHLKQMALTPRQQFKRLAIGTVGAVVCMILNWFTGDLESEALFYLLSGLMILSIVYAIPGYLGVWLWRMRKSLFNID